MINLVHLRALLEVLALVRDLLKEFPADGDLIAIRADMVARIRALKP